MVFWTTLLIIHGLLAVALLGAITHQAVSVWCPVRAPAGSFVTRFRAVPSTSYVWPIIVLYAVTFVMGAWIYTQYRFTSRLALEQLRFFKTVGVFEMKEHLATIGLILLPAYWAFWRRPLSAEYAGARKQVTLAARASGLDKFPDRPYRQQRPGIRLVTATDKIRDLRYYVYRRLCSHLRDLHGIQPSAPHLSSCDSGRSISCGSLRTPWPGDVLVRVDADRPLIGASAPRFDRNTHPRASGCSGRSCSAALAAVAYLVVYTRRAVHLRQGDRRAWSS